MSEIGSNVEEQIDRIKEWQRLLIRWQSVVIFGPFVLMVIFAQTSIANELPSWTVLPTIIVPVVWAVAVKGYVVYLGYQN